MDILLTIFFILASIVFITCFLRAFILKDRISSFLSGVAFGYMMMYLFVW